MTATSRHSDREAIEPATDIAATLAARMCDVSDDDALLDRAVAELSAAVLCRDTRANRTWLFGAYARWCHLQGLSPLPCPERQIMGYLHAVGQRWSAVHRRTVALSIGWAHTEAGYTDPRGTELGNYLRAASAAFGQRRQEPVHALTSDDVAAMVYASQQSDEQGTLDRARNAIIRAAAGAGFDWLRPGRPWARLLDIPVTSMRCIDGAVQVTPVTGRPFLVEQDVDQLGHAALVEILDRHAQPAAEPGRHCDADVASAAHVHPLSFSGRDDLRRFQALWRRVRGNWEQQAALPTADELRSWSDEQWWWHQRLVPRDAERSVRDVAWLLVGWAHGARFADLHDATVVTRTGDDRWHLRTTQHKTTRDGTAPLDLLVIHLAECGLLCPACALSDHLDLQQRKGEVYGPLFATNYRGARRMTGANARMQLRAMWLQAGGSPEVAVTTRSMRSGAAVTATERGAHIEEVQRLLRQADTRATRHYLRRRDPDLVEVHITY